MRKSVALLLALLMAFHSFGILLIYWAEIQECKIEFKEHVSANQHSQSLFVIFNQKNKDFQLNDDNEILSQGKLYDVVEKKIVKGNIIYYALADNKEDLCVHNLSQFSKNNLSGNPIPVKTAFQISIKCIGPEKCFDALSLFSMRSLSKINYISNLIFPVSPLREINTPPPEFLFC